MTMSNTREIIDRIFKEPDIKYELTEFESLGKPTHEILWISPITVETGRDAGKTKYYLKSIVPFSSGKDEVQVYMEGGKSSPEEFVCQLWVYKLIHQYGYQPDEIDLEKSVQFGTEVGTKTADIIDNTLFDIPKRGQQPKDVLAARKTLLDLKLEFNFKEIIQGLEELVLADRDKDEFNEILYIRIKELSLSLPLDPINSVKIPLQFVSERFPTATNGDYVLAVIGATIGKINLIDELMKGFLFSNNTACLSPRSPMHFPNAMELIFCSPIVKHQVQQRMAKTAQEKITDPELKKILLPCLDSALMSELEKLCLDSKHNYFASKKLLDQAKTRVEQFIEEAAVR